jgi:hypothetical protein
MIDIYCERVSPALWAEPVNAVTNLSFVVAGFLAWRLARDRGQIDVGTGTLVLLVFAIGIGSFLFHTFATRWAMAADVLPILLFQVLFFWLYGRRVIGWHPLVGGGALALFLAAVFASGSLSHYLNGSLGYAPAWATLLLLGLWHWRRAAPEPRVLLLAALVLFVSLAFRSVDMAACDALSTGTHFLWHLLNGWVLYLCIRGLLAGSGKDAAVADPA